MADQAQFSRYNVIAAYPDMDTARAVIASLENRGVDAEQLSLLGRQAEEAMERRGTERDEAMLDKGTKTAVGGALTGTGVGGALGFLSGLAAFGIPGIGPAVGAGIWATTLGGAAAGGGVGLAASGYAKIKESQAWALTYDSVSDGQVIVGVHSDDEQDVEQSAEILAGHDPETLNYFDAEGNRVHRE